MGFDDSFQIVVSDTQAYRQFGNSVVVPVIKSVAAAMEPYIISDNQSYAKRAVSV
jgi:DNA (cytosine-5)-methyltransferase 1